MKTFIVITKDRQFAEFIESDNIDLFLPVVHDNAIYLPHIKSKLLNMAKEYKFTIVIEEDLDVYLISDFMDMINNDDINMSNYFMSYIFVK
jgi:hypothetical protein